MRLSLYDLLGHKLNHTLPFCIRELCVHYGDDLEYLSYLEKLTFRQIISRYLFEREMLSIQANVVAIPKLVEKFVYPNHYAESEVPYITRRHLIKRCLSELNPLDLNGLIMYLSQEIANEG